MAGKDILKGAKFTGFMNMTCKSGALAIGIMVDMKEGLAGGGYFYPSRIAEIPDPYTPPVVVVNPQPPVVVAPQAPAPTPVQPQPAAQSWYYCESVKSYYPYVPSCPEGWKTVPAQPSTVPH